MHFRGIGEMLMISTRQIQLWPIYSFSFKKGFRIYSRFQSTVTDNIGEKIYSSSFFFFLIFIKYRNLFLIVTEPGQSKIQTTAD
jgi:hypothetical protein